MMKSELPNLPEDPTTAAEWQEAVDIARAALHVANVERSNLATGEHEAYVERAFELIQRGQSLGFEPREDECNEQ